MKKISTLLMIATILITSCKNEPKIDYKYQDNKDLFNCDAVDMDLIKEAVYAFESYIEKNYCFIPPNSVDKGYYFYWEIAIADRIPAVELIEPHVLLIRDELKKIDDLWITKNDVTTLNFNHPFTKCISSAIQDLQIKRTFDVLTESNTFNNFTFLSGIERDPIKIYNDRGLSTYIAMNTFYARILNLDFSDIDKLMQINKRKFMEKQRESIEKFQKQQLDQSNPIKIDSSKIKN